MYLLLGSVIIVSRKYLVHRNENSYKLAQGPRVTSKALSHMVEQQQNVPLCELRHRVGRDDGEKRLEP